MLKDSGIRSERTSLGLVFPIIGDPLYGQQPVTTRLFLQHAAFYWDDFSVSVLPDWQEVAELRSLPLVF